MGAYKLLQMNLGTICFDFCEPVVFSEVASKKIKESPSFNPYDSDKDRMALQMLLDTTTLTEAAESTDQDK